MKIDIHPFDWDKRKEHFSKRFKEESKRTNEFLRLASIGQINKGKRISIKRQSKYLDMLTIFLSNIKKPLNTFSKRDMEDFVEKLNTNKIKKRNKQNYSEETKTDVLILIRTYFKFAFPEKAEELTNWFDTSIKKKTPEILTEQEVEKLYLSCKSNEERFLISVLFDGGFRIEEFLNILHSDIEEPTQSFPYYKITIREETSKTDGRTIGLYWKHSTEAIRNYLNDCRDKSTSKQVFPKTYDAVRVFLSRLGRKVLKKRIHAHIFRKSSATYYANKDLGREKLCIRYGWKFSSDMPDVYIKRSGIKEEQTKEKFFNTSVQELEKELNEMKTKMALNTEREQEYLSTAKRFKEELEEIKAKIKN